MMVLAVVIVMQVPAPARGRPQSATAEARCNALYEEFLAASRKWSDATDRAIPTEETARIPRPDGGAYARKFLAIARENPDEPVAAVALERAIAVDPFGESWGEAIDGLVARHARSPAIGAALATIAFELSRTDVEPFLRRVLEENPAAPVRASAAQALANHLLRLAKTARHLREHPDRAESAAKAVGEEGVRRIRDRDEATLRHEAERLFELLQREYAELPCGVRGKITFGDRADGALRELRDLVVGKPAQEITGVDAEGRPLKLSEYRGKVVVLSWWASWCGPCMDLVPHERELARRHEGRPFAILGINGDEGEDRMRQQIAEHGITWRSWVDGGPEGPISTSWNVAAWPTIYVLDADGIIRYKGHRDEEALDRAVEAAMATAASEPPRRDGADDRR